ncbi:MAG TPA: hypothetical protein VIE44_00775 [Methylomirabilota bacterium]|jgi:hypothetical protein
MSPVVPQDARHLVELHANVSNEGASGQTRFQVIDAIGELSDGPYALPPNTALVVTDVLVTRNATEGVYEGWVDSMPGPQGGQTESRIRFRFDSTQQGMLHLPLSSGVVFANPPVVWGSAVNPGWFTIRLLGYLTPYLGRLMPPVVPEPPVLA